MITDDDIDKAVDYLRDSATKAAKAKAERIYLEEFRRVVKSNIMRENKDESLGAQEAIAYSDPRYKQHLAVMKDAIERDEYHRWMMTAAEAKIEAWRTQQSNARAYRNAPYSEPAPPQAAPPAEAIPPHASGADQKSGHGHITGSADVDAMNAMAWKDDEPAAPSPHAKLQTALGFASKTINERFKGRLITSKCKSVGELTAAQAEAALTWLQARVDEESAQQGAQ